VPRWAKDAMGRQRGEQAGVAGGPKRAAGELSCFIGHILSAISVTSNDGYRAGCVTGGSRNRI